MDFMEGFYDGRLERISQHVNIYPMYAEILKEYDALLPLKWDSLKPDPIHVLINHSDCDGEISWEVCEPLAKRLKELMPLLPSGYGPGHIKNWRDTTQQFIDGLMLAYSLEENVRFG